MHTLESSPQLFPRNVDTGIKHGTIRVILSHIAYEITTYRSEKDYIDARRPEQIQFINSLEEDLKRRDFTINAFAFDLETSMLIDQEDGLTDLKASLIRCIGNAKERFMEDALRPIRACRLAATLDFTLEELTYEALHDQEVHKRSKKIAIERFTQEFRKGMRAQKPAVMLSLLEKTKLLNIFMPLNRFFPHSCPTSHKQQSCFTTLNEMHQSNYLLKIAFWWYNLQLTESKALSKLTKDLTLSRAESTDITYYMQYFQFQEMQSHEIQSHEMQSHEIQKNTPLLYPATVRLFLSNIKSRYKNKTIDFITSCQYYIGNHIDTKELIYIVENYPLVYKDLAIDGEAILKLGYQGQEIGQILKSLLEQVIQEPSFNTKEKLIALIPQIEAKELKE